MIAGVGNVYRNELLFRHRIDPYRPGTQIDEGEFTATWTDSVALMKVGVRRGKIITVRPEHDHGVPSYGPGRPRTYVYRRAGEPCRVCGTSDPHSRIGGPQHVLVPNLPNVSLCDRNCGSAAKNSEDRGLHKFRVDNLRLRSRRSRLRNRRRRPNRRHPSRHRRRRSRPAAVAAVVAATALAAAVIDALVIALREACSYPLPCMPENIALNSNTDPIPHAPATSAGFHHGSEYQPRGRDDRRPGRRDSSSGCARRAPGTPRSRGPRRSLAGLRSRCPPCADRPTSPAPVLGPCPSPRGLPGCSRGPPGRSPWRAAPAWRWWPARSANPRPCTARMRRQGPAWMRRRCRSG